MFKQPRDKETWGCCYSLLENNSMYPLGYVTQGLLTASGASYNNDSSDSDSDPDIPLALSCPSFNVINVSNLATVHLANMITINTNFDPTLSANKKCPVPKDHYLGFLWTERERAVAENTYVPGDIDDFEWRVCLNV